MWEPISDDCLQNYNDTSKESSPEEDNSQDQPWFKSIFNTVRKYKKELFGESVSSICIRKQRILDYTIAPNYKFVFAKYLDGLYRPASIMARSKKLQLFIMYFYHNSQCGYVKPRDLLIRHGNLLERKVWFFYEGHKKKGKVYGNNSPANHGFPSVFYLRKNGRWYKISYKCIYLTKKQINNIYFVKPRRRSSNSMHSRLSVRSCKHKW